MNGNSPGPDERVTVKLGLREWVAVSFAVLTIAGVLYQMRVEVMAEMMANRFELVAIKERLGEFISHQSATDDRQDVRTLRIEERQADVRERLRSIEDLRGKRTP